MTNEVTTKSNAIRLSSPDEWQLPDISDVSNHKVRFFFRPCRLLRFELAVEQPDGMHSQVLACTDLAGRAVANHENLAGLQPGSFLNFVESRFLGEHVAAISVINFFDGWLTVQAKRLHLGALDLRLAEADDEVSDTPFGQRAQERQRPRKKFKPADRAIEVGFTREQG